MSFPQTSVATTPARGVVGGIARSGPHKISKRRGNGICRAGHYVVFAGEDCAHPSAVPGVGTRGGVVLKNDQSVDGHYADNTMVDVMEEGYVFIDPEAAVVLDSPAYARFVTVTTEQKGAFRADPGGATGGVTITVDTAVNAGVYTADLVGPSGVVKRFSYIADSDATTTEIATGLKTAIDADAEFVATNPTGPTILVVGTTATFEVAVVAHDSRITPVSNAAAFKVPGAVYRSSGSALTELQLGVL